MRKAILILALLALVLGSAAAAAQDDDYMMSPPPQDPIDLSTHDWPWVAWAPPCAYSTEQMLLSLEASNLGLSGPYRSIITQECDDIATGIPEEQRVTYEMTVCPMVYTDANGFTWSNPNACAQGEFNRLVWNSNTMKGNNLVFSITGVPTLPGVGLALYAACVVAAEQAEITYGFAIPPPFNAERWCGAIVMAGFDVLAACLWANTAATENRTICWSSRQIPDPVRAQACWKYHLYSRVAGAICGLPMP
jgi:hypothetical protein